MAAKRMTPSEMLVGRKLPPEPAYRDILLVCHVKEDGTFCGRSNPVEQHLSAPFLKMKRDGLIRMGMRISFGGRLGKNDGIWFLTPKGEKEAVEANVRVLARRAERKEWTADLMVALKAAREKTSPDPEVCAPETDGEDSPSP